MGTVNKILQLVSGRKKTIGSIEAICLYDLELNNSLKIINIINEFSIDTTLGGNSDSAVPTEKAVKAYVDSLILLHDTFLELTDTPVAYTSANALYTTNGTPNAVIETTVILTEGVNTFNITKGTAILDIAPGATLNIDTGLQVKTNAGILDFTGVSKTLSIDESEIISNYHTNARATTWLAANHETTYVHTDIALNTTHRGSDGSDHSKINDAKILALLGI